MPRPALGVVIPHHSQAGLLAMLLPRLAPYPIFVVDDSRAGVQPGAIPRGVTLLRSRGEEGFSRACNLGLAAVQDAGLPLALLLNDDARPLEGCIARLLEAWQAQPDVAAVGPLLLDPTGAIESAGIRVHRWSARVRQQRRVPRGMRDVDALSGACLLIESHRRLDEGYRFGFEDIALCQELKRQGRRIILAPEARCEHLGGASMDRRSRPATRHALAGHLRLVAGRRGRTPMVLGMALAQVIREGGPPRRLLGLWEGWRDHRGF